MKIIYMTLYKQWFDEILSGNKKEEYRNLNDYWTKRLFNNEGKPKDFKFIIFRNGYQKNARQMKIQFKGLKKEKNRYVIKLGKII